MGIYIILAETMPETIGVFAPVNVRGGDSKLPNTDPEDPKKEDLNSPQFPFFFHAIPI